MNWSGPRADRIAALVFLALGIAMLVGGFRMDRLEIRQIHPASIPGLVPMILGGALALCAALLYAGARTRNDERAAPEDGVARFSNWRDLLFTAVYSTVYALLLVGNMPFALATAIYILVFVAHFTWAPSAPWSRRIRQLVLAAAYAAVCAVSVAALFRYGFLVRLP